MNHETVTFNLAAIPSRTESLHKVILSILPQADAVNVYLNGFETVPQFLYHPKIHCYKSQEEVGDLGDAGKFYRVASLKGYIFTVDDDLVYPKDYAETLIRQIERFKRKAVITCHGRRFNIGRPVQSMILACRHSALLKPAIWPMFGWRCFATKRKSPYFAFSIRQNGSAKAKSTTAITPSGISAMAMTRSKRHK